MPACSRGNLPQSTKRCPGGGDRCWPAPQAGGGEAREQEPHEDEDEAQHDPLLQKRQVSDSAQLLQSSSDLVEICAVAMACLRVGAYHALRRAGAQSPPNDGLRVQAR